MAYTVILADGTRLNNLTLNGDNFISVNKIDELVFENNTSPVTIINNDNGDTETRQYTELNQLIKFQGEYWFVLRDLTQAELDKIDIQSKLDYIAMMTDVDLEDFDV